MSYTFSDVHVGSVTTVRRVSPSVYRTDPNRAAIISNHYYIFQVCVNDVALRISQYH